jgi:hypothetical protein
LSAPRWRGAKWLMTFADVIATSPADRRGAARRRLAGERLAASVLEPAESRWNCSILIGGYSSRRGVRSRRPPPHCRHRAGADRGLKTSARAMVEGTLGVRMWCTPVRGSACGHRHRSPTAEAPTPPQRAGAQAAAPAARHADWASPDGAMFPHLTLYRYDRARACCGGACQAVAEERHG